MRGLVVVVALLAGLYGWFTFPEGKSDDGGNYNDGGAPAKIMNPLTLQAEESLRAGKLDLCDGVWGRWKYNLRVIPENLFQMGLIPKEETECQVAIDFAVVGIYFGYRDLGYPSGLADELTPPKTATVNQIRTALDLIRKEAVSKGIRY